jgi:YVTN family beta-propeller protein
MARRTVLSALALAVAAALPAAAQWPTIITDKAPSEIIQEPGSTRLHVLTAGVDRNFNGALELDSGDVAPRWFVVDTETNRIVDSTTFDAFFNSYPLRVGLDNVSRRLYVAQAGRIRAYDIGSLDLVDDTVALGFYSGVSFDPRTRLVLAHLRPGFTSVGWLFGINPLSGDTMGIFRLGVNPQMSIATADALDRGSAVFSISEGSFGAPNALLSYSGGNPDVFSAVNGAALGDDPSDMDSYRNGVNVTVLVALRGANTVHVIDTRTHRLTRTIAVTEPTSVSFDSNAYGSIVVGTASGMLHRYREYDVAPRDSFALPAPIGPMAWRTTLGAVVAADSLIVLLDAAQGRLLDTIDAGGAISSLFFDGAGHLNVIGANGDGSGWWRVLDRTTFALRYERTIAGFEAAAVGERIAHDVMTDSVFAIVRASGSGRLVVAGYKAGDTISARSTVFDDSTGRGVVASVGISSEHIAVLERSTSPGSSLGFLHVIERSSGERILMAPAGIRPIESAFITRGRQGAYGLYVLSEGDDAPTLAHVAFAEDLLRGDTLGSGANHLLILANEQEAAVTMNGSHTLVRVDLQAGTVIDRMSTGTTGFDGPREAIELVGGIEPGFAVTTYAGDVRLMESGTTYRVEPTGGKSEGIVRVGNLLYIANPFTPDYGPDSTVVIIDLTPSSAPIEASSFASLEQNVPNPASDRATVRFSLASAAHVRLEIRSVDGAIVATPLDRTIDAGAHSVELPIDELPQGTYLYTLRAGSSVVSRMMQVIR